MSKHRYLIIGAGSRANMFLTAIVEDFPEHASLVGLLDINPARMDWYNHVRLPELRHPAVPTYPAQALAQAVKETQATHLIVTTIDRTHHRYIIQAMELGCDVISEKPMTIDGEKAQEVIDAIRRTGKKLRVTFNYRYAPRNSLVKELLMNGAIGRVLSVHFEWLLDTKHGADYFRRWHRDKRNSGGLMVHKATHHFDLVNWWLSTRPRTVFAQGSLAFYGRENAELRGMNSFYQRATGNPLAVNDPFALHLDQHPALKAQYLDAELHDGYQRDQSVFGDGINIEDDMAVNVRYHNGATMSYHLTAYSPWEGYRIAFNGTKGRLEYDCEENSYVSGSEGDINRPDLVGSHEHIPPEPVRILVRHLWEKPQRIVIPAESHDNHGHGGGDRRMLADIFVGGQADPLGRAADHRDGCWSILTGIAANRSMATGLPVDTASLITGL